MAEKRRVFGTDSNDGQEVEWTLMRPVGLEFLDQAPLRIEVLVETSLPRQAVWDAFTDPTTWPEWFPRVRSASYPDQGPPYGVGTRRVADVDGALMDETILAWDELERWTYRIDRCTTPLANAQVESTELADAPDGGTRVTWILVSDPKQQLAGAGEALQGILERLLTRALRNLEQYIATSA